MELSDDLMFPLVMMAVVFGWMLCASHPCLSLVLPPRLKPDYEWPMTQPIYGQPSTLQHPVPDQDRKWSSPMIQQLTPSMLLLDWGRGKRRLLCGLG
jgi:hypothetical protein